MSDDKPHEYVPFHGILWPGDYRARAEQAEAERNNLAEALRQVNARLVEVTADRDAARERVVELEIVLGAHFERPKQANPVIELLRQELETATNGIRDAKNELAAMAAERDDARHDVIAMRDENERVVEELRAALARAEKCEHERALSQQLCEDDHR